MPRLRIEKPFKGITKQFQTPSASMEARPNEYVRSDGIDLFRPGFEGHITPARIFNGTAVTSNINSLVRAAVNDPSQTVPATYLMLGGLSATAPRWVKLADGAYVIHEDIAADAGDNFTAIPSGTGFWGEDIALYNVSGAKRIFFSWCDNDDADVGILNPSDSHNENATNDDDFMSTTPTGAAKLTTNVPHRLVEGADAKLYITNGRYLASYDGATSTFTAQAYDLGDGWIATDIRSWKGFLIIVGIKVGSAYRSTDYNVRSRVTFWDYTQNGLGIVYDIEDPIATAAFVAEDILYLFTQGKSLTAKLRAFDGSRFIVKKEWRTGLLGSAPQPNGIDFYLGNIVWVPGDSSGGVVATYSPLYDGLHWSYYLNDGTNDVTTIAMLKNFYRADLFVGALVGGSYKLLMGNDNSSYSTLKNWKDQLRALPFKGSITDIILYFSQFVSGASCRATITKGSTALSVGGAADELAGSALHTASTAGTTEWHINDTAITDVSSFYLNLRVSGQISVSAIEIHWQPSQAIP